MKSFRSFRVLVFVIVLGSIPVCVTAVQSGQMTSALHISLAPTFLDPAETPGVIAPFMVLYALHHGLVKSMPGNATLGGER